MSPEEQDELAIRWLGPGNTYEKLGVRCSAYEEKVIKAHRNLIKKLHPDKNKSPRADEAFKVMSNEVEVHGARLQQKICGEVGPVEPPEVEAQLPKA